MSESEGESEGSCKGEIAMIIYGKKQCDECKVEYDQIFALIVDSEKKSRMKDHIIKYNGLLHPIGQFFLDHKERFETLRKKYSDDMVCIATLGELYNNTYVKYQDGNNDDAYEFALSIYSTLGQTTKIFEEGRYALMANAMQT